MKKFILSSALLAFVLAACTTTKDKEESVVVKSTTTSSTTAQLEPQQEELPKERAIFHGSETILTDLVHTSLQVEFDWEKSQLKGIEFLKTFGCDRSINPVEAEPVSVITSCESS